MNARSHGPIETLGVAFDRPQHCPREHQWNILTSCFREEEDLVANSKVPPYINLLFYVLINYLQYEDMLFLSNKFLSAH